MYMKVYKVVCGLILLGVLKFQTFGSIPISHGVEKNGFEFGLFGIGFSFDKFFSLTNSVGVGLGLKEQTGLLTTSISSYQQLRLINGGDKGFSFSLINELGVSYDYTNIRGGNRFSYLASGIGISYYVTDAHPSPYYISLNYIPIWNQNGLLGFRGLGITSGIEVYIPLGNDAVFLGLNGENGTLLFGLKSHISALAMY